ncbi:hypothetical protein KI387_008305, partial [Taxus chinensis]
MDGYEKLEKVGEGTYGKVYKAKDISTGQLVALKKLKLECDEEGISGNTLREISLLKALSNNLYIVRLLDVKQTENKKGKPLLYLVFQYMTSDLKKYIAGYCCSNKQIPPQIIKRFMYQICKGVAYCHSRGVMHRFSNLCGLDIIMTLWYRAPEVLLGDTHYSTAVDMWSVGCIFAEMCRLKTPFMGDSEINQLHVIFECLGTPDENIWPGVTKLKDWHIYPQWKNTELKHLVPDLEPSGLDLLS